MSILITVFILGIIIFIHELGHFLTAKYFKMPVSEFAIGMGPRLFSIEKGGTAYSIRAIPIGGFVNIEGMEVDSKVEDGFNTKSPLQRFIVLFAGVFMNFILAFVIVFTMIMAAGNVEQSEEPVVGKVLDTSASYQLLKEGDRFLELKGQQVQSWSDISLIVGENTSEKVSAKIKRGEDILDLNLNLSYDETRKFYVIGILPVYEVEKYTFFKGLSVSFETFIKLFSQTIEGIKMIFSGKVKAEEISGPVGMIKIVGQISKGGVMVLIWLTALLSVNIGIFNLLPFPALDGGRIIFVILEILGVKVNKKLEEKFHAIGMLLLIFLIILITFNDLRKFF